MTKRITDQSSMHQSTEINCNKRNTGSNLLEGIIMREQTHQYSLCNSFQFLQIDIPFLLSNQRKLRDSGSRGALHVPDTFSWVSKKLYIVIRNRGRTSWSYLDTIKRHISVHIKPSSLSLSCKFEEFLIFATVSISSKFAYYLISTML